MKKNKGFTLVELLATVVILGVITALSFPLLKRFTENSENRKFDIYGQSLIDSAKSYVDAYETDLFDYDQHGVEQTDKKACISVEMLEQKKIYKDINYDNFSCKTDNTFIKVTKEYKLVDSVSKKYNTSYKYELYLGCGIKQVGTNVFEISYVKSPDGELHAMGDVC